MLESVCIRTVLADDFDVYIGQPFCESGPNEFSLDISESEEKPTEPGMPEPD